MSKKMQNVQIDVEEDLRSIFDYLNNPALEKVVIEIDADMQTKQPKEMKISFYLDKNAN